MKYYLIDEIPSKDVERLSGFLVNNATASGLDKVFWIQVPENLLNETQFSHTDCRPYFFAIELGTGLLKAEFFVRTRNRFSCDCNNIPDEKQRRFIMEFVDGMIKELEIRT